MKERLTNNLGLKALSIFLAFFLWLLVVNVSNPVVQRSKDVTVEVINESVLSSKQQTYEIVGRNKVTVTYDVRTRDAYKISTSDFRVYADLADLYDVTGSIPLKVEIANEGVRSLIEGTPTANPLVIRVKTENIQRKRFDLKAIVTGTQEEGYAVGAVTLSPDYVYVRGPQSQIGQINSVGIPIDIDNVNSDVSGKAKPVLYDSNGNEITVGEKVTVSEAEVSYEIPILKVKNLNLDFDVAGKAADGYQFTGVECSLKNISVVGLKSALANYSTLTIPGDVLDISGLTMDKTVTVDLTRYLPEGVTMIGENRTAEITLKIEALQNRSLRLDISQIEKTGAKEDFVYYYDKTFIDVTVRGLAEDLESLTVGDLHASINLEDLTEGTTQGVLSFQLGSGFSVAYYTDFIVTVESKDPVETDENGETLTGDDIEAGGRPDGGTASGEDEADNEEELSESDEEETLPAIGQ